MTEPVDVAAIRALIIPATRTVYRTADIRGKTNARVAILAVLPDVLEEIEQLRAAVRLHAAATDIWMERAGDAEARLAEARAAREDQP